MSKRLWFLNFFIHFLNFSDDLCPYFLNNFRIHFCCFPHYFLQSKEITVMQHNLTKNFLQCQQFLFTFFCLSALTKHQKFFNSLAFPFFFPLERPKSQMSIHSFWTILKPKLLPRFSAISVSRKKCLSLNCSKHIFWPRFKCVFTSNILLSAAWTLEGK